MLMADIGKSSLLFLFCNVIIRGKPAIICDNITNFPLYKNTKTDIMKTYDA